MPRSETLYDVAVIGGGPAGMMAAGRAAELGAAVVLVEKNARLGTKLLMTGGGRCNLMNSCPDTRKLAESYGKNGKFLLSTLSRFGPSETFAFFRTRGLPLKTEVGGRVFPASDRAADVLGLLSDYLRKGGVKVLTRSPVTGITARDGIITAAGLPEGGITASHYILCTGGKSYPSTGSTGEGYGWLKRLGHTITPLAPVLAPIRVHEGWVRKSEGASVSDAALTLHAGGTKTASVRGEAVFTREGISGPAALDMTRLMRGLDGEMTLTIDIRPDESADALGRELLSLFGQHENMLMGNLAKLIVAPKLAQLYLGLAGIDPGKRVNLVTRQERNRLAGLIKGLSLSVSGVGGFNRAMVTGGGVSLDEIDQKSMRSKIVSNLSVAGEILDLDGPTGGYNLQVCWSTGYIAGERWTGGR